MQQTNTQKVISKVQELVVQAKEIHGLTIPMPVIVFDIRQSSRLIGQCIYKDPRVLGKSKLRFNLAYMSKDIEVYMETVIHEFAHLVVYYVYGVDCGHDARFARVVRSFGGAHTGATTNAYSKSTPVVPAPATGNVATFVKPTESNDAEKLALIKKLLGDLSIDSLRTLNTDVVDLLKHKRVVIGNQITRQLNVGDLVEFTHSKTGQIHKLKITKFSRDGSKIVGSEIGSFMSWKVPATFLRPSN